MEDDVGHTIAPSAIQKLAETEQMKFQWQIYFV